MNFQNLSFDYVEPPRQFTQFAHHGFIPRSPRTPSGQSHDTLRHPDYASNQPATPSQPTIIPYAPSPPSPPSSASDIYGPDRLFGPPLALPGYAFAFPASRPPLLTLDEIQSISLETAKAGQMTFGESYKDQLALEAGKVTPGVDDGPNIQYALDALTRDRSPAYADHTPPSSADGIEPFPRYVHDSGFTYYPPAVVPALPFPAPVQPGRSQFRDPVLLPSEAPRHRPLAAFAPTPSPNSSLSTLVPQPKVLLPTVPKDTWVLLDHDRFTRHDRLLLPRPDFRPPILRPRSMIALMTLCLLMITALMFSAIYSQLRGGLVAYGGSIYGGRYFVFRILPQLLAAIIQLYAHAVVMAVFRILPFSNMEGTTHKIPEDRYGAIFQDLYPASLLWPQLPDTWQIWVPCLIIWLANIALPLQSALFSVILVDGGWRWATVQGIAWTLVVLYIALLVAFAILFWYWRNRKTGLIWDPRSIADVVALATNSNVLDDYRGTELLGTRAELKSALRRRVVDKLGYWGWGDQRNRSAWHGIGTDWQDEAWLDRNTQNLAAGSEKNVAGAHGLDQDPEAPRPRAAQVRFRYLPWCMRNNQILYFILTGVVLLVALLVVSFLPSTSIKAGFLPWVPAGPVSGAFSSANFLYSFLPSLLGLVMWLLFQSLELSLRILQPWAELQAHNRSLAGGARPEASILADYAACLPLQSTWHALRNRHWRVAALSLLSTLFVLLPALGGGLFMALTAPSGDVRMFPNVPLFAVVLTLLVLYVLALIAMLPGRRAFRLPHAVTCLAEIISFVSTDDLMSDDIFKEVWHKTSLRGKIGVDMAPDVQPRWYFGPGIGEDTRLGVRRVRRYTELEKRMSRRQRRQLQLPVTV